MKFVSTAVLIPLLALWLVLPTEGSVPADAVVPFGWRMLVLAQVLCGLPLAWAIGRLPPKGSEIAGIGIGLLLAALTVLLGTTVGAVLQQADFLSRLAVRVLWVLTLQVPWAWAFRDGRWPTVAEIFLAVVLAVAVPAVYVQSLIHSATSEVARLVDESRMVSAVSPLAGLVAVGARWPSGDPTGPDLTRLLKELHELNTEAQRAGSARRLGALLQLERYEEAAQLLRRAPLEARTYRTMGIIRQRQRRFAESDELLHKALKEASTAEQVEIFDSLAFNARESGRFADAEALYQQALEKLPTHQAHFHFQLGRHYQEGGRPALALQHLRRAAELDADRYGASSAKIIQHIEQQTPGCLLRLSGR